MALIKPKKRIGVSKKKKIDDGALFEKFAIEYGIWAIRSDGQITEWNCGYKTQEEIREKFTIWKNKFEKESK